MLCTIAEVFAENGLLAGTLANYERREGQQRMAEAVSAVLAGSSADPDESADSAAILLVEAETGIGKTLAYCIPAVFSGKRIVISTATINLQDQIMGKDIPLIEQVLQQPVEAICLKGRQNYLCLYRWYQYRSVIAADGAVDDDIARIEKWLQTTEYGDRAELSWLPDGASIWPRISAQANQCLGNDCPDAPLCFLQRVRRKASMAKIVVVNHHLFFSDLAVRQTGHAEVIPRYQCAIFDEAHHLENVATAYFGFSFSQYQLLDLLADISRLAKQDCSGKEMQRLSAAIVGLEQRVDQFFLLLPSQKGRYLLQAAVETISRQWFEQVDVINSGLLRLGQELERCQPYGEGWKHFSKRVAELQDNLQRIAAALFSEDATGYVYWYEKRERTTVLSATPVQVTDLLQQLLYSKVEACVLTSATLSSGGSFSYIQERLGLPPETQCLQVPSPFDYPGRTVLYIPQKDFPEPASPRFAEAACRKTIELLEQSRGRALLLFTSIKAMEYCADYLAEHSQYQLFVQGSAARNVLLQNFQRDTHSLLLAVASFWEGIDVPGESLSMVIIDKLPFEVPSDPVLEARISQITQAGGNAFLALQIPRAILSLRQGVGRLMRQASDQGALAILDVRLFTRKYGRLFLKSLPPAPVVRDIDEVARFFRRISHQ